MAPDDLVQAALQRGDVKRPRHAHCTRNVIEIAGGVELVNQPQALLRERERRSVAPFPAPDRGRDGRLLLQSLPFQFE